MKETIIAGGYEAVAPPPPPPLPASTPGEDVADSPEKRTEIQQTKVVEYLDDHPPLPSDSQLPFPPESEPLLQPPLPTDTPPD